MFSGVTAVGRKDFFWLTGKRETRKTEKIDFAPPHFFYATDNALQNLSDRVSILCVCVNVILWFSVKYW